MPACSGIDFFFLYLFTSIVTYCALFMLTFIILLLKITDTLDKTL